jgi:ATP-dependent Lon protease
MFSNSYNAFALGLDIFQHYEMKETFVFANRMQQYRPCKAFEVTFIYRPDGAVRE